MQLHPDLVIANSGGMSARVVSEELELRAHGTATEQNPSIKISTRQRLVDIVGLGTQPEDPNDSIRTAKRAIENPSRATEDENALGMSEATSTLRMSLTDLKCYRLPGESVEVTRWP